MKKITLYGVECWVSDYIMLECGNTGRYISMNKEGANKELVAYTLAGELIENPKPLIK